MSKEAGNFKPKADILSFQVDFGLKMIFSTSKPLSNSVIFFFDQSFFCLSADAEKKRSHQKMLKKLQAFFDLILVIPIVSKP